MTRTLPGWAVLASGTCAFVALASSALAGPHDALITKHAAANGVPESLVRRVIHIESKGNPRVISKGNYGLMQIRLGTAKSMGYGGTAEGLLDADTNMTYAVKYLATAYRAAGCSEDRAISYYQRGFYKRPVSSCGPRPQPIVQVAAKKESAPAADAVGEQLSAADRISAPFEVLRPKIVQVQTIVRPKTFNAPAQNVQAQNGQAANAQAGASAQAASAQASNTPAPSEQPSAAAPSVPAPSVPALSVPASSAPVQSASLQLATAPAAAVPAEIKSSETKSSETKSPDLQLPLSPPLPRPAHRPEVAAVQTVAKAPDVEQVWPPALTPEQPAVAILPMPKPRPAKAPKALARLDATGQDVAGQDLAKQDAVASDVATTDQSSAERAEPAASVETQMAKLDPEAVPLPQPKPEVDETPERESKSTRHSRHRHFRARAKKPETPALIALFQKLTTPTPPARRRR